MSILLNSKTYDGFGFDPNAVYQYVERSGGTPSSFSKLTAKVSYTGNGGNTPVKWKLAIPVVATTDTECSCAGATLRTYYVTVDVTVPAGSTAAERTDLLARLQDLMNSTQFETSITALTQPST